MSEYIIEKFESLTSNRQLRSTDSSFEWIKDLLVNVAKKQNKEYAELNESTHQSLKEIISKKDEKIDMLEEQLDDIRNQLDNVGQYTRQDNFKVLGIQVEENETTTNLKEKVCQIAEHNGVTLTEDDISMAHRINTKFDKTDPNKMNSRGTQKKIPSILVKLKSRSKKAEIMASRKTMRENNESAPAHLKDIAIYEDVTPLRSRMLHALRNRKNEDNTKKWEFVWSRDGRIFCRTKAESEQRVAHPISNKQVMPQPKIVNKVQDLVILGFTREEINDIKLNRQTNQPTPQ